MEKPMPSILMLTNDTSQLDRRIFQEAASLAKVGFQVTIASVYPDLVLPNTLPQGVQFIAVIPPFTKTISKANIWILLAKIRRKFGHLSWMVRPYQWALVSYQDIAQMSTKLFVSKQWATWDIVVAHDVPMLPTAVALQHKQGRGKIVLDAHELYDAQFAIQSKKARKYWLNMTKQYLPNCDAVMIVAETVKQEFIKRYEFKGTPVVVQNACPYESLNNTKQGLLRKFYGLSEKCRIVLCMGGITPGRTLEELIEAMVYVLDANVKLVFLGFGLPNYIEKLQRLIIKRQVSDKVFLGKAVKPDQVISYATDADLGIITNRGEGPNNTLGGPNRLYEYIQARLPILSYEHLGVERVLSQTQTGWTIHWKNPQHLAEIMMEKLEQAHKMPKERLEEAAKQVCWEQEEQKLVNLFNNLLNKSEV
jgi:alpha-maltose-1-phosphate synthase